MPKPCHDVSVALNVMGWELLEIKYWGDEGPRQKKLEEWLHKVDLNFVGKYYIDVSTNFWISVDDWKPSTNQGQAWQVFEKIKNHKDCWKGPYIRYNIETGEYIFGIVCTGDCGGDEFETVMIADTMELCICRAALSLVLNKI